MVLKLFGAGRPDHPLADPKEAKRILEALPPQDLKALEELSQWLESVSSAEGFKPADRLQLIGSLDDLALARARKVSRDYFAATRPSRYQENLMWTRLHEYWRQAGLAWGRAVEVAVQAKDMKSLPLLACRALRALGQQLKWQHMRYGPIDAAVWGAINKLYLAAEERKLAEAKVPVGAETSARLEFLKSAMFSASSPDGLLPTQIELAERVVADQAAAFLLTNAPAREHLFWTDLQQAIAPQRAVKAMPATPGLRGIGPGAAMSSIESLAAKIRQTRQVPSSMNLGATYDYEVVLEVLDHLALHWAHEPPERRHARHPVKSRLTVANGFKGAIDCLGGLNFDKQSGEAWIVENVSAGGFGAVVPQVKGDWLRVGALLALQPDGGTNWVVGVVRRVNKVTNQEARVGIETVSRAPQVLEFGLGALGRHTGILLPSAVLGSGEVSVALPANVYSRGLNLEADFGGRQHMYMPASGAERGEDYELLRFREMVRDG